MIGVVLVYWTLGLLYAGVALMAVSDTRDPARWRRGLFWGLFAVSLMFGDQLGDLGDGGLVVVLAAVSGLKGLSRSAPEDLAGRRVDDGPLASTPRLFTPLLMVPAVTLIAAAALPRLHLGGGPLAAQKDAAPLALALAVVLSLVAAVMLLRPRPLEPLRAAGRLCDAVGSVALLPQTLAALGAVFVLSGVGGEVGRLIGGVAALDNRLIVVCVFTGGMAAFTVLMGNAFAAFPVMISAVGAPILISRLGADPAVIGAVGMLSGFCGTLLTPMAANFNLVPVALLGLKNRYAVIRAQAPTALTLLCANTCILYLFAFGR